MVGKCVVGGIEKMARGRWREMTEVFGEDEIEVMTEVMEVEIREVIVIIWVRVEIEKMGYGIWNRSVSRYGCLNVSRKRDSGHWSRSRNQIWSQSWR